MHVDICDKIGKFMQEELLQLAKELGEVLRDKKLTLVTAESCTGGWLAEIITAVPNCSHYFERGFVTYSNAAKIEMLGVSQETLAKAGAVSMATAREMAEGAIKHSHAEVSLAVTGIAGPGGGTSDKPVGTVYFSWGLPNKVFHTAKQNFSGNREKIRYQAVRYALAELTRFLKTT